MNRNTMIMIKKIGIFSLLLSMLGLTGCYEDYKNDFEYTTTYFARQFPLRSLVDEEGKEMSFELGAVLGGKYSNEANESVNFIIQDTLMNAYPDLIQLPEEYYSLEKEVITIPSGKYKGHIKVTLDKEKFMNDEMAVEDKYVLPVQITSTSLDSILGEKHYSMIMLRYFNQYHGWYYLKGVDHTLDGSGNIASSFVYSESDLTENQDMMFTTLAKDTVRVEYDWDERVVKPKYNMVMAIDGETISIEQKDETSGITNNMGTGSYDKTTRKFILEYTYTDTDGANHSVNDTLYYRNTELRFEEWQ